MSYDPSNLERGSAGRRSPGLLLIGLVAVLLALATGALGYVIGRGTAASPAARPTTAAVAQFDTPTAAPPTAAPPTTAPSTAVPPTDTPTPPPTATATATAAPLTPSPTPAISLDGQSPLAGADLGTFYQAWDIVAGEYDGALPPAEELLQSAIAGSLEALGDDYTRYVSPDVAERTREDMNGAVEGIGAMVRENDEGLFEIVRPIDGQPADLAGLKAGDVVIEVDGQSALEMSFDEVILLVRGPAGTSVTLTVMREDEPEPLEFTIVRARFEVAVVEYEMLPVEMTGGAAIGYIHLTEFGRTAEATLMEALTAILAQQPAG